jgi:hypothetical protein
MAIIKFNNFETTRLISTRESVGDESVSMFYAACSRATWDGRELSQAQFR